jgi:hypothetical protein
VAATFGEDPKDVARWVAEAKRRGLLTRSRRGVAGGTLTDAGVAALKEGERGKHP